jgi:hypothetical protein
VPNNNLSARKPADTLQIQDVADRIPNLSVYGE